MIRSNFRRYLPLLLFLMTLCALYASGLAQDAAVAAKEPDKQATIWSTIKEGGALVDLIRDSSWKGARGFSTALALTDAFLDLWDRNRAILRVVDLATAEGDLHFQNIRTHLLNEVTLALRDVIEGFREQRKHPHDLDPMAQAAALVSMLAHVAAHRYGYEFWGIRVDKMRESVARLLYVGVAGRTAH